MFQDIKVSWKGEERELRSTRILKTIAMVEEIIAINELAGFSDPKNIRMAKLAAAHGTLLRAAGYSVTDDEAYAAMLDRSGEGSSTARQAIIDLLTLMIPKRAVTEEEANKALAGNVQGAPNAKSSKKSTKHLSRANAS